ncbi:signal transduction histidine kinase [Granulicella aggregans]|uniref:Signal transduction histidine kinase n=1 Tax=Granulicella aggregans TaxID=474949 RepID=A0A7W8E5R5_9BACT|nr:ATP-binding protein [Granulicella aggregans]MBB5059584.1 signal transduction histidine kinase [Granulicella aggregans]
MPTFTSRYIVAACVAATSAMAGRMFPASMRSWTFDLAAVVLVALFGWGYYIFSLKQASEAVRTRLCERLAERERIARDLHDTFFQGVQGLLLSFQSASQRLPANDLTRGLIEATLVESDRVMLEGRELVLDLRTRSTECNELGRDLTAAAVEFSRIAAASYQVVTEGPSMRLNSIVSEDIYRLCKEALHNAFVHAAASEIVVTIVYGRRDLRITVRDNGRGIPREILQRGSVPNHWGLIGMRERAVKIGAQLAIASTPRLGTEILVTIPGQLAYRVERGPTLSKLFSDWPDLLRTRKYSSHQLRLR